MAARQPVTRGTLIDADDVDITCVVGFAVDTDDLVRGTMAVPVHGARFDIAFAGRTTRRLAGILEAADDALMAADGSIALNGRAIVLLDQSDRIALTAGGVVITRDNEPTFGLSETVQMITTSVQQSWVSGGQIRAFGILAALSNRIRVQGYRQWSDLQIRQRRAASQERTFNLR